MDNNWKFSELKYERPDKEKVVAKMRDMTKRMTEAQSGEELLALIMESEEWSRKLADHGGWGKSRRHHCQNQSRNAA